MKTVTVNPTLTEVVQTWAQSNPIEAFAAMTIGLMVLVTVAQIKGWF